MNRIKHALSEVCQDSRFMMNATEYGTESAMAKSEHARNRMYMFLGVCKDVTI